MRVIVADASGTLRSALGQLLRGEGYEIAGEAADGRALVALLGKVRAEIVCLDHALPHCDSGALIKSLHAHEHLRDVSVVMMSAAKSEDAHTEAAHAGVAGFLRKPFSQSQVVAELRQVAHARRLLADLAAKPVAAPAARRCRAVIADDSETQRKLLRAILEEAGCDVVAEASDGAAAVAAVAEHAPDLACLDVEMPIMNGMEALSQIVAAKPGLRVMMITSHTEREIVKDAAARGARGYIVKPYQPEKVRAAIDHLIAGA